MTLTLSPLIVKPCTLTRFHVQSKHTNERSTEGKGRMSATKEEPDLTMNQIERIRRRIRDDNVSAALDSIRLRRYKSFALILQVLQEGNTTETTHKLLFHACIQGRVQAVRIIVDLCPETDLNYVDFISQSPFFTTIRQCGQHHTPQDTLDVLDVMQASGKSICMVDERPVNQYRYKHVLDMFSFRPCMTDVRILLKCMQMGAWDVTTERFNVGGDERKLHTLSIICSRRTIMLFKRKASPKHPAIRTRIPNELWRKLIQLLSAE